MLYKYSAWKNSHIQENIINNIWWFNTPIDFNDPFDINPSFDMDEKDKECLIKELRIPKPIGDSLSVEQILAFIRQGDRGKRYNSRYGIFCLSCKNDDILMWSHYGDQHKGICLGFDIPKEGMQLRDQSERNIIEDKDFAVKLLEMEYKSERPKFKYGKISNPMQMIEKILRVKSEKWSYEKEKRIMIRAEQEEFFPCELRYPPEYLTEVIIGANASIGDFLDITGFIEDNSLRVNVFLSTLDKDEYKLGIISLTGEQLEQVNSNLKKVKDYDINEIKEYWKSQGKYTKFLELTDDKFREKWKKGIDQIPVYCIWEYTPHFFDINMETFLYKKECAINEFLIEVILLKELIADNIEYEMKWDKRNQ